MKTTVFAIALTTMLALAPQADAQAKGKKAPVNSPDPALVAGGLTAFGITIIIVCIVGGLLSFALYLLPIFIALGRGHPNVLAISAVCFLFGWSFIGWGIALVWSLTATTKT